MRAWMARLDGVPLRSPLAQSRARA